MYLVHSFEIDKIKSGKMSIKEIEKPERKILLTYIGEDLMEECIRKKISLSDEQFENLVDKTQKYLENCDCWMCISEAFSLALKSVISGERREDV